MTSLSDTQTFLKWAIRTPRTWMLLKHWINCQPSTLTDLLTELKYWINVRIFSCVWDKSFSCHIIYKHANLCSGVFKSRPNSYESTFFLICLFDSMPPNLHLFISDNLKPLIQWLQTALRVSVTPDKTTRTSESRILRTPLIGEEDSAFGSPSICSQTLIYYLHFKCATGLPPMRFQDWDSWSSPPPLQ